MVGLNRGSDSQVSHVLHIGGGPNADYVLQSNQLPVLSRCAHIS